ncbi:MAG: hypothetical protein ABIH85_08515 [Candidatus Omnitrophota bacterium]
MIKQTVKNMKNNFQDYAGRVFLRNLLLNLRAQGEIFLQRESAYYEWLHSNLVKFANEFVKTNGMENSCFVKRMKNAFGAEKFCVYLNKFIVEYLSKLFEKLDDSRVCRHDLVLEDNPVNHFGVDKYRAEFGKIKTIKWQKKQTGLAKIVGVFLKDIIVFQLSLSRGIKFSTAKKKYKVMREALWGLYDAGGSYFHDDFFVDDEKIKKEEVVFYSRGLSAASGRVKPYNDAVKSQYASFNVKDLKIGARAFFERILTKYIFASNYALFSELRSPNYSLFASMYLYFVRYAVPYEKIFSNYEIGAELGHNFYSPGHVVESIICRSYGTKYNLMHWSDTAVKIDKYLTSHLGCDNYFVWGNAHITGVEGGENIIKPTGYVFKRFIKKVMADKDKVLSRMGVSTGKKVVSFFDETFRSRCKMTEQHYLNFWRATLDFARKNQDCTVLVKPKTLERYKGLSKELIVKFLDIKDDFENLSNTHIIDDKKWSFIEVIGVSDVAITQGMFSSATIAIICGIEGLYLDEAGYNHPFRERFKDRIVFDDSEKLTKMIEAIVNGSESPLKDIPETLLREFDAFSDDGAIDRFRDVLIQNEGIYKNEQN